MYTYRQLLCSLYPLHCRHFRHSPASCVSLLPISITVAWETVFLSSMFDFGSVAIILAELSSFWTMLLLSTASKARKFLVPLFCKKLKTGYFIFSSECTVDGLASWCQVSGLSTCQEPVASCHTTIQPLCQYLQIVQLVINRDYLTIEPLSGFPIRNYY